MTYTLMMHDIICNCMVVSVYIVVSGTYYYSTIYNLVFCEYLIPHGGMASSISPPAFNFARQMNDQSG